MESFLRNATVLHSTGIFAVAEFYQLPGTDAYWVEASTFPQQTPDTNARLEVKIHEPTREHSRYHDIAFRGSAQPDVFMRAPAFAAFVKKSSNTAFQGGTYTVNVFFVDDPAASSAALPQSVFAAVRTCTTRTTGVDIPRKLALCAPSPHVDEGRLWKEIDRSPHRAALIQKYDDAVSMFKLDVHQEKLASKVLRTTNGVAMMGGVSGSGKTYSLVGTLSAMAVLARDPRVSRRPGLISAPRTTTLAVLLKMFITYAKEFEIEVCFFPGAYAQRTTQNLDQQEVDRLEAEAWDTIKKLPNEACAEPELWEYYFQNRLGRYIQECRDNLSHSYNSFAIQLDEHRKRVVDSELPKDETDESKKKLRVLNGLLTRWYLQEKVEYVLCTNWTASHPTLKAFFQPKILAQEDYDQPKFVESATSAATFKDHIDLLIHVVNHPH